MPSFIPDPAIVAQLVEIYRGAVPPDIASARRNLDEAYTIAAMMAVVYSTVASWAAGIAIGTANGSQLDAQGTNVGLKRQGSEVDDTYRARLQVPPPAGTWQSIVDALQAVVTAAGGPSGSVYILELPRDGVFLSRGFYTRNGLKTVIFPGSQDAGVVMASKNSSFLSRGRRISGGAVRMVIALIPAGFNALGACTDALRTHVSAAKAYRVEEYTS